jgi:hypothetical protein
VTVDQLNIDGMAVFKLENNPPVRPNRHRPVSLWITFELMQTISGEIKGLGRRGHVENSQYPLNDVQQVRADSAAASFS